MFFGLDSSPVYAECQISPSDFLRKGSGQRKKERLPAPGQKAFLPYALIIFPFAAMPQKSFKDPAPSLCIPARLPDGAFQALLCSVCAGGG
jgi:hypothetical protein